MIGNTSQIFTSSEEILDFILTQSLNSKENFIEEIATKYKNVDIDPDFINFRNIIYDIAKIDYWESLLDNFTFEFGNNVVANFKYYNNVPFQEDNNFLRGYDRFKMKFMKMKMLRNIIVMLLEKQLLNYYTINLLYRLLAILLIIICEIIMLTKLKKLLEMF